MNRRKALAALLGLPSLGSISVADVKPGDVIVAECEGHLSQDSQEGIMAHLRTLWPEPQRILICDGDIRLKVIREQAIDKGWIPSD